MILPPQFQIRGMHTAIRDREVNRSDLSFTAIASFVSSSSTVSVTCPSTRKWCWRDQRPIQGRGVCNKLCGVSIIRSGEAMENALRACCKGSRSANCSSSVETRMACSCGKEARIHPRCHNQGSGRGHYESFRTTSPIDTCSARPNLSHERQRRRHRFASSAAFKRRRFSLTVMASAGVHHCTAIPANEGDHVRGRRRSRATIIRFFRASVNSAIVTLARRFHPSSSCNPERLNMAVIRGRRRQPCNCTQIFFYTLTTLSYSYNNHSIDHVFAFLFRDDSNSGGFRNSPSRFFARLLRERRHLFVVHVRILGPPRPLQRLLLTLLLFNRAYRLYLRIRASARPPSHAVEAPAARRAVVQLSVN